MSNIDFALKDFYRKKGQTYPYVIIITLIIASAIFFVNISSSLGINPIAQNFATQEGLNNQYYFSGAINLVYSQFNTLIFILILLLSVIITFIVTTTFIITKKRDIAIMKALGTLPKNLYGFYLTEAYIIFIIGFILGLILGLLSFGIVILILYFLNFQIIIQIDFFYTSILFFTCLAGIFMITGYKLRKIGNQKIIKTFSGNINYKHDASKELSFIPKWLSSFGFNLKIAISNTTRRKGEYRRYILVFSIIFLVIFTLGLGTFVLASSSQEWIHKSQGDDIIAIGHEDTINYYSKMYEMFSNPEISINKNDINFTDSRYLFNLSDIDELHNIDEIEKIDERLIKFCDTLEMDGYYYYTSEEGATGYEIVGQKRTGTFPIIGVNPEKIIQNFEIEGRFFNNDESFENMTIGDGLAYNYFDYCFSQSLKLVNLKHKFKISGVVIDSFYNGYAGYIGLDVFQEELNFTNNEINLILIKLESGKYKDIKEELEEIIKSNLGQDFTHLNLEEVFKTNLLFLFHLSLYPMFLILIITIVAFILLYNYQKAGLIEKAKDFLIMRAVGTKNKALKKIMFLEALFIIIPSLFLSLSIGMILNSLFLFDRVYLPPFYIPLMVISFLFCVFLIVNYLSLIPIMKKINKFNIKDFAIY